MSSSRRPTRRCSVRPPSRSARRSPASTTSPTSPATLAAERAASIWVRGARTPRQPGPAPTGPPRRGRRPGGARHRRPPRRPLDDTGARRGHQVGPAHRSSAKPARARHSPPSPGRTVRDAPDPVPGRRIRVPVQCRSGTCSSTRTASRSRDLSASSTRVSDCHTPSTADTSMPVRPSPQRGVVCEFGEDAVADLRLGEALVDGYPRPPGRCWGRSSVRPPGLRPDMGTAPHHLQFHGVRGITNAVRTT
ncbi:hypothetical protein SVIOM342S_10037 [Streptomyces violaceorubidus]